MTVSFARDLEIREAICRGEVSYDLTICVFPFGKVTVMSSRGLPESELTYYGNTCYLSLILGPMFLEDLDSVVDEFRGRRELRVNVLLPKKITSNDEAPAFLSFFLSFFGFAAS